MTDPGITAAEVYCQMYESLAEEQQVQRVMGHDLMAAKAGYFATVVRGALDAELKDPEPVDWPYRLCCSTCTAFLVRLGRQA